MAIIFKKRLVREDISDEFYKSSSEFYSYVQQNYINSGKIIVFRKEEYLDDLGGVVEYETIYRDQSAFDEALVDLEFKKDAEKLTDYCCGTSIYLLSVQLNDIVKEIPPDPDRTTPVDPQSLFS